MTRDEILADIRQRGEERARQASIDTMAALGEACGMTPEQLETYRLACRKAFS